MYTNSYPMHRLANLLLKAQQEFQNTMASSGALRVPLDFSFKSGQTSSSVVVNKDSGNLELAFSADQKSYAMSVPLKDFKTSKAVLTLKNGEKTETKEFVLADFLKLNVPDEFKTMHAKTIDTLNQFVPASVLEEMNLTQGKLVKAAESVLNSFLGSQETKEVDEFSTIEISVWDQPNIRFQGKLIGNVSSIAKNGRYHVFQIFETKSKKFVGVKSGVSVWLGEYDKTEVKVVENLEELVNFFSYSALSKALYEQVNLKTYTEI